MKLILLTTLLFLTSCKTFVINVKPAPRWEISEVRPHYAKCVRIGTFPRRFLRSRKQFYSLRGCNTSLELAKVKNRINRRY